MEFKKTKETILSLQEKDVVTIGDIMGLIVQDICKDVNITDLPIGELETAVPLLCNLMRVISRIYTKNETEIQSTEFRTNWQKAEERLKQAKESLEIIEKECKDNEEQRSRLQKALSQYQAKEQLNKELEEQRGLLSQELKEREDLLITINNVKDQIVQEKERKETLEEEEKTERNEFNQLEAQNRETSAVCSEYKNKIKAEKKQQDLLQKEANDLSLELAAVRTNIEVLQNSIVDLNKSMEDHGNNIKDLKEQIRVETENEHELKTMMEGLKASYTQLCSSQESFKRLYIVLKRDEEPAGEWMADENIYKKVCAICENRIKNAEAAMNSYQELLKCVEEGGLE